MVGGLINSVLGVDTGQVPYPRLAYLYMVKAHKQEHRRTASDPLFRSCKDAWIHHGKKLAERVIKDCLWCHKKNKKISKQKMAHLPTDLLKLYWSIQDQRNGEQQMKVCRA